MNTVLSVQNAAAFVPASERHGDCGVCHGSTGVDNQGALVLQEPALCQQCHSNRADHIILVRPGKMKTELPLSNGLMTCITCHDYHSDQSLQLRLPTPALCNACHD